MGVLAVTGLAAVVPAQAASAYPTAPSGVKVTSITANAFTITSTRVPNVERYKVWASTEQSDLYVANLSKSISRRAYKSSTSPAIWLTPLPYKAVPYYYRYATSRGSNLSVSAVHTVYLRPNAPSALTVDTGTSTPSLSWRSADATTYQIAQTAPGVPARTYTIRNVNSRFTPLALTAGTTYSFRVRAVNGTSASAWSASTSATARAAGVGLKFLTYNVLGVSVENGAAPWATARRSAVAGLVTEADADVVAVQEADYCRGGNRQVDDLVSSLRGYGLADTEIPTRQSNLCPRLLKSASGPVPCYTGDADCQATSVGSYLLYRSSSVRPIGRGSYEQLGIQPGTLSRMFASYQLFQTVATGTQFLAVSLHLSAGARDTLNDGARRAQMTIALDAARTKASGAPIVVLGDTNSLYRASRTNDGPGIAARAAGFSDASDVAQWLTNQQYDSNNQYQRVAPKGQGSIDRVFASPGVGLSSWKELLHVDGSGTFIGTIPSDHNPVLVSAYLPR